MSKTFSRYSVLAFCSLLIFQVCDYVLVASEKTTINGQYIFGLVGTNIIAAIMSLLALVFLWLILKKHKNVHLPLLIISVATLSNSLDRIFYGGVVDYIGLWSWPSFNLADIAIVAGIIIIAYQLIFGPKS